MSDNNGPLLRIENLKTHFHTADGVVRAVDGVTLEIAPGQTLGLVGESGCGKSVTAFSVLRLLPSRLARIVDGAIWFMRRNGECIDLVSLDPYGDEIRSIRGNEIAMIFQEPMTSLSPVHTIGDQISEAIALHQGLSPEEAMRRAVEMLAEVGMALPEQRVRQYPHQLSGGMRQRAMIAMALSCNPALLIADEPTTALDVTIQAQILDLMRRLQSRHNAAILMITHNLGVVAEMADHVAVMYMGRVVESGSVRHIFKNPLHPYTVGLLQSVPRLGSSQRARLAPIPGTVPDPFSVPSGCPFRPRCKADKRPACSGEEEVPMVDVEPGHQVRCALYQ
jgi:oligopeptide/dipeptide ABC transporter ATP-binding protein